MEKNFILNRRTVLGGAAALGTVGVLAACGSSKDSKATTKGATVGTDAKELYDLAEAAVSELKDGGTLRLAIQVLVGLQPFQRGWQLPVHPDRYEPRGLRRPVAG